MDPFPNLPLLNILNMCRTICEEIFLTRTIILVIALSYYKYRCDPWLVCICSSFYLDQPSEAVIKAQFSLLDLIDLNELTRINLIYLIGEFYTHVMPSMSIKIDFMDAKLLGHIFLHSHRLFDGYQVIRVVIYIFQVYLVGHVFSYI